MKTTRVIIWVSTVLGLTLLSACAGKDFIRPPEGTFILGKTTWTEIRSSVGASERVSTVVKNGRQVKLVSYLYGSALGAPLHQGVTPGRGITLGFDNDILVSHSFQSSFQTDNSEFDETKATQIVKGQTSQAQIRQLLGPPTGEQIFPFADTPGKTNWIYSYSHFRSTTELQRRTYNKTLIIRFTANGVVEDYELAISGEKF